MLLAESAYVEIHNQVNAGQAQSSSVTTTTINGVTTTETKTYNSGEPVKVSIIASASAQPTYHLQPPTYNPSPIPSPVLGSHTGSPRSSGLKSLIVSFFSRLLNLFIK